MSMPAPSDRARIGFLGAGRLGKALAWALHQAGEPVVAVASASLASAQALAARVPGCAAVAPEALSAACELVFVTTRDGAIASATDALRWRAGSGVVHCSGATEVSALDSAREQGALTGGFHPLQTFGDPEAAVRSLPGSTITIEAADPALRATLRRLAARLGCRVLELPPGMRGRYHAAAGYTSQFINALFGQAAAIWRSWGADEAQALAALLPMAQGTLAAIGAAGIAGGMPGPVSRGDIGSVRKHVESLAPLGPEVLDFYRTLCAATVPLARSAGGIDSAQANALLELLRCAQTTPGSTFSSENSQSPAWINNLLLHKQ